MKRLAFVLAAALFALTGCTSAAETATAAEPATTPETTTEPTSKPAAAETGPLYTYSHRYAQDVVYDVMPAFNDQLDHIGTNVYKNDLNAGQVSLFYSCDDCCIADPYVTSDAVYLLTYNRDRDNKIIALSPDGTKTHEIPFDPYASTVVLYSDRYFYCMDGLAPYDTASGFRLDLQTGETTPWDLPAETAAAPDAAGNFAVTARLISDHPVPFTSDPEISDALLQNSMLEYDLTDVTTGKPATKIAEFPYKGADDGSDYVYYTYLGKSGDDFYFTGEHSRSSEEGIKMSVLRVGSDGTQEDLGLMIHVSLRELRQNGEIQWLFAMSSNPGTLTVYDLPARRGLVLLSCFHAGRWSVAAKHRLRSRSRLHDPIRYHPRRRIFEREYRVYGDGVCGVSVIARAVFTGRKWARVVGDADPYGLAVGLSAARGLPAVAVSVRINKTQPPQCFPHCRGWVV